uniref:Uncharacterized protein n=1 Tax=Pyramimonas obovata TaxID=1411642 RepID=A0A7S0N834_9CHLO|mmetsp:Transcript_22717/g.49752  ORF Transcript_22717/g.49752 Transcript_22717/m.49752 type:complete len:197 (+) Transcript_22717:123-713(+)|eukprot:CAMPEP_0118948082 /NCGR_PEP_ID=MMETSP1169-20130426/47201_1 /TAXON_ID=36882 /ORGANISM="Pyramimonas obovata, Strain CCMP722" /LENGTH=196 /DNA_ID=CAMNT_0006894431 /DNA_START=47 /DNA_END=637 /DNA_ORIENTATION=-
MTAAKSVPQVGATADKNKVFAVQMQLDMMANIRKQNFERALELADEVLRYEPDNAVCLQMREVLKEKVALDEESSDSSDDSSNDSETEGGEPSGEGADVEGESDEESDGSDESEGSESAQADRAADNADNAGENAQTSDGADDTDDDEEESIGPMPELTKPPNTLPSPELAKVMRQILADDEEEKKAVEGVKKWTI